MWHGWTLAAALILLAFGLYALGDEILAAVQGGHSTISELTWILWAEQPWVIWLVSVITSNVIGFLVARTVWTSEKVLLWGSAFLIVAFLCGHFFAQASDKYAEIRKKPEDA